MYSAEAKAMLSRKWLGLGFGLVVAGGGLMGEGRADHWNRNPRQCGPQRGPVVVGGAGVGRPVYAGRPIVVVPNGSTQYGYRNFGVPAYGYRDFGVPAYGYRMPADPGFRYGGARPNYGRYPAPGGWRQDGWGNGPSYGPAYGPSYGGGAFPPGPSFGGGGWGISIYGR